MPACTYVRRILADAPAGNATAVLRLHVTQCLNAAVGGRGDVLALDQLLGVIRASPAPCFAIDRTKRLVGYNAEFERHVARQFSKAPQHDRSQGASVMADARLSLEQSVERIIELHDEDDKATLDCGYLLSTPTHRHAGRVRTSLVRARDADIVLAYVLS